MYLILTKYIQTNYWAEKKTFRVVAYKIRRHYCFFILFIFSAGKLIEACSQVGGSCLEQTTWLRRNYAVRSELQAEAADDVDPNEVGLRIIQGV